MPKVNLLISTQESVSSQNTFHVGQWHHLLPSCSGQKNLIIILYSSHTPHLIHLILRRLYRD